MSTHTDPISKPVPFGLSLTAGAGLVLMILALAFGVVQGAAANSTAIGVAFAAGLGLLLIGFIGWLAVVRPFERFDDINVPQYTGHHDASHDASHTEPHADAASHDDNAIIPHG